MKRSLQFKLIITYLAVALLTVLVVSLFIRLRSGQQFINLVMEQQASLLQQEAGFYYEQTGSWDGFFEYYLANSRPDEPAPNQGDPGDYRPEPGRFPREIRGKHGLVDAEYRAIMPFIDFQIGEQVDEKFLENLLPVEMDGQTVAWIIPDRSTQYQLSSEEQLFLARTNQAILLAALAGVLAAVLMGVVLARSFLKPVRSLIGASQKMAAGDLEQQVPVHSQDELGELSRTFNQMSADLAKADRQRRQMTADITHDLSTPLQVIAGYMEMLEDEEVTLTPERARIIMNEIELLRRLVGDLSLLTTADAKELHMELEPLEPGELLEGIRGSHEALALRENKQIRVAVEVGLPLIQVDRGRMVQVIGNLVDNAIRYTPAGGEIVLSARHAGGQVELRVQDSGKGIHPDDLPYVFDRFYKADPSRGGNSGKMGLGLAIARALVLAQGGTIEVESAGKGTTFVLRFKGE